MLMPDKTEMKPSDFEPRPIAQLEALLQTTINSVLEPNVSYLAVIVDDWVTIIWLRFVSAWREP